VVYGAVKVVTNLALRCLSVPSCAEHRLWHLRPFLLVMWPPAARRRKWPPCLVQWPLDSTRKFRV
jgi:hypothetical protein